MSTWPPSEDTGAPERPAETPRLARDTTPENPWPLRHVRWGNGDTRVLLWSQMHGDENTASMALADPFRFLGEHPRHPLVERLRIGTRLHVIPILNPDGAARFQSRRA